MPNQLPHTLKSESIVFKSLYLDNNLHNNRCWKIVKLKIQFFERLYGAFKSWSQIDFRKKNQFKDTVDS